MDNEKSNTYILAFRHTQYNNKYIIIISTCTCDITVDIEHKYNHLLKFLLWISPHNYSETTFDKVHTPESEIRNMKCKDKWPDILKFDWPSVRIEWPQGN